MTISIYRRAREGGLLPCEGRLKKMPGGEWHASPPPPFGGTCSNDEVAFVQGASADDLLALAVWADAVHRDGGTPSALIPYLPGARQDRRHPGEALSARVYADLINSMRPRCVVYLDPHSVAMPACLNNGVEVPLSVIASAVLEPECFDGVIAPDAGAFRRATTIAQLLEVPCFQASKRRDPKTGKLSEFTCEPLPETGRFLVVDDICDGGGTFYGLAAATGLPPERLGLYVTHGIFSKGAESLHLSFSSIYTTDSHPSTAYAPPITRRASVLGAMASCLNRLYPT